MIRLDGLAVRVGKFALRDISLEVPAGGYGLIIGPTGSGKTTLLEAVAGHVAPAEGRVFLRGEDVTRAAPEARRVGFVYQQYHLFPHYSVRENIGYGLRDAAGTDREARIAELAGLLGLRDLLDRGVTGLSGGEQQRIALARALAPRPSILLLDEPFAAVDHATRRGLRRELTLLHEREKITILQVTHDFEDAMRLGNLVAVLADGRVVQSGTPEEVFRYPNSPFVADFVGTGTVLKGTLERLGPAAGAGKFAAMFHTGALHLEVVAEREGDAHAVLRPADLILTRDGPAGPAPRNRLQGVITRIERGPAVAHVFLDVSGTPLVAAVMATTAEEMALGIGETVEVAVKATAIHLI